MIMQRSNAPPEYIYQVSEWSSDKGIQISNKIVTLKRFSVVANPFGFAIPLTYRLRIKCPHDDPVDRFPGCVDDVTHAALTHMAIYSQIWPTRVQATIIHVHPMLQLSIL